MADIQTIRNQVLQGVRDLRQTNYKDPELHFYFTELLEMISEVVAEIGGAAGSQFGVSAQTISLATTENSEALASDFLYVANDEGGNPRVFHSDGTRIYRATPSERDGYKYNTTTAAVTGKAQKFWEDETTIFFWPKADQAYTITLEYFPKETLSDLVSNLLVSENTPWNGRFDKILRRGAIKACRERTAQFVYQPLDREAYMEMVHEAVRVATFREGWDLKPAPGYGWGGTE